MRRVTRWICCNCDLQITRPCSKDLHFVGREIRRVRLQRVEFLAYR